MNYLINILCAFLEAHGIAPCYIADAPDIDACTTVIPNAPQAVGTLPIVAEIFQIEARDLAYQDVLDKNWAAYNALNISQVPDVFRACARRVLSIAVQTPPTYIGKDTTGTRHLSAFFVKIIVSEGGC